MKLKLTSIAVMSLFTCAASAQSSVTIYGMADSGILSISNNSNPALGYLPNSTNGGAVVGVKDGGMGLSFWGIRGSEDIGNGMKANFNLRGNFSTQTGAGGGPNSSGGLSLFNQEANVGISGDFGSIKAGRVIAPVFYAFAATDVRGGAYFGSSLTGLIGLNSATGAFAGSNSNAPIATIYNDNAIVYVSPKISGITASFEYAFGEVAGNTSAGRQIVGTLAYDDPHLKLDAIYYTGNDNGIVASLNPQGHTTNRLMQIGAMYTFDALSLSIGYWKAENPTFPGAGTNPAKFGGAATTGSLNMINYGLGYRISPLLNLTSGVYSIKDNNNSANKSVMYVVGADYALSKSTKLYLEAANVNNHGSNMNQSPVYAQPVTAGVTTHAWMAGINHRF
ncbi:Outer membrane protein (porin) [Collimonas sp. OK307]|uniref:porin n=1 Tax=Collimonas sp. OK307 TaxID=1801620 RepID=UPI0008EF5C2C|nr:porin [Collimonas sp. OK307]SFH94112.1 Outer membrane protein (porin) [Collimonas sp. OK307]